MVDTLDRLSTGYFGYEVVGLILDSPYCDAREMVMDAVCGRVWFVPRAAVGYVVGVVEGRAVGRLTDAGIMGMN